MLVFSKTKNGSGDALRRLIRVIMEGAVPWIVTDWELVHGDLKWDTKQQRLDAGPPNMYCITWKNVVYGYFNVWNIVWLMTERNPVYWRMLMLNTTISPYITATHNCGANCGIQNVKRGMFLSAQYVPVCSRSTNIFEFQI